MTEEVLQDGKEIKRQIKVDPKELVMKIVFIIAAVVFIAAVVTICVFIFVQAVPALKEIGLFNFLFSSEWDRRRRYGRRELRHRHDDRRFYLYYGGRADRGRSHRVPYGGFYGALLPETAV